MTNKLHSLITMTKNQEISKHFCLPYSKEIESTSLKRKRKWSFVLDSFQENQKKRFFSNPTILKSKNIMIYIPLICGYFQFKVFFLSHNDCIDIKTDVLWYQQKLMQIRLKQEKSLSLFQALHSETWQKFSRIWQARVRK